MSGELPPDGNKPPPSPEEEQTILVDPELLTPASATPQVTEDPSPPQETAPTTQATTTPAEEPQAPIEEEQDEPPPPRYIAPPPRRPPSQPRSEEWSLRRFVISAVLLLLFFLILGGIYTSYTNEGRFFLTRKEGSLVCERGRFFPFGKSDYLPQPRYAPLEIPPELDVSVAEFHSPEELDAAYVGLLLGQIQRDTRKAVDNDDTEACEVARRLLDRMTMFPAVDQDIVSHLDGKLSLVEARVNIENAKKELEKAKRHLKAAERAGEDSQRDLRDRLEATQRALDGRPPQCPTPPPCPTLPLQKSVAAPVTPPLTPDSRPSLPRPVWEMFPPGAIPEKKPSSAPTPAPPGSIPATPNKTNGDRGVLL